MIIKFVEIFTEYLSIIFCIHKIDRKKIKVGYESILYLGIYLVLIVLSNKINYLKILCYLYWFVYIKLHISDNMKKVIKSFFFMIVLVPSMQVIIYSLLGKILVGKISFEVIGILVNITICLLIILWKKEYLSILEKFIIKYKNVIIIILVSLLFMLLFSYLLEDRIIHSYMLDELLIYVLILLTIVVVLVDSQNQKNHKAEELRIYKLYTHTFEEAINVIRMRQHEFDNHINAIKCMQYTIHNAEQLVEEQNKYCEKILKENKYNKLLKLNTSPILLGYLYSKFTAVSAEGIDVEFEIQDVEIEEHIEISDLIEIIGILFDNAVEALEGRENKSIIFCIHESEHGIYIDIANVSDIIPNTSIEKFFKCGYSTKGEGHGIGLNRANEIKKKCGADIQVENICIHDANYLRFRVILLNKNRKVAD